jgi:YHS domain-containing protein
MSRFASTFSTLSVAAIAAVALFFGTAPSWAQGSHSKHGDSEASMNHEGSSEKSKAAMTGSENEGKKAAVKVSASQAYPIDVCIVSGKPLDENAVVKTIDGRELRFCCGACPGEFEANKDAFTKKLDAAIVKAQKDTYPLDVCVVSGEELGEMGEAVDYVYNNRLVRFCCNGCVSDFKKDPDKYVAKLNKAVVEKQKAEYPLTKCVVSGESLGEMGEPIAYVYNNELVLLCCNGCKKQFDKDPAKYMAKIDEAGKGGAEGEAPSAGEGEKGMHEGHTDSHGSHSKQD